MFVEVIVSVIVLVVGIAILVIIHVCVVGRAFRGDPANGTTSTPIRAVRFPSMKDEDVKELPCFEYNLESGSGECAVCLENFRAGDKCRTLPKCSHSFHADCIDSWLLKSAGACPICRTGVKSPEFDQTSSSFSGEAGVELI